MAIFPLSAIFPLEACTMANSLTLDLQWDLRSVMQMVHALDNKDEFFQQSDHVFHTLLSIWKCFGAAGEFGKTEITFSRNETFAFMGMVMSIYGIWNFWCFRVNHLILLLCIQHSVSTCGILHCRDVSGYIQMWPPWDVVDLNWVFWCVIIREKSCELL